MSASDLPFDPYLKWLGIRCPEQQPDHYRLLGLERFEDDPNIITHAADSRIAFLRWKRGEPQGALADRLIDEITQAKACLLNAERKRAYDMVLAGPDPIEPEAELLGQEPPLPPEPATPAPEIEIAPVDLSPPEPIFTGKVKALLAVVLLLAAAVSAVALRNQARQRERQEARLRGIERVEENLSSEHAATWDVAKAPAHTVEAPAVQTKKKPALLPLTPIDPNEGNKPADSQANDRSPPADTAMILPAPAGTAFNAIAGPQMSTKPPDAPEDRKAAPAVAARDAAAKTIREVFDKDLAAARLPAQRVLLADKLYQQAVATGDDLAARYMLFEMAADMAASAGEIGRAMEIVDELGKWYSVSTPALKAQTLARALETSRVVAAANPVISQEIAETALALAEDAVVRDQFAEAEQLAKAALAGAKRTKLGGLLRLTADHIRDIEHLQQPAKEAVAAAEKLVQQPGDTAANLTVGRWKCLVKNQWDEGLTNLMQSGDADLAGLARDDLAKPKAAAAQVALAERWWRRAESEEPWFKQQMQLRAVYWYKAALATPVTKADPGLTPTQKAEASKRVSELASAVPLVQPRIKSVVKTGNVARGARVQGGGAELVDGVTAGYANNSGVARSKIPSQWTVTLDNVYLVRELRLFLCDKPAGMAYRYAISVSSDGQTFTPMIDRSQGQWYGWQVLRIPARPVKAIRVQGLGASSGNFFVAVELEAYCVPPTTAAPTTTRAAPAPGKR